MADANSSHANDLGRAIAVLDENLTLLSGHRPERQRLVAGQAHVHRIALTWRGSHGGIVLCLQVLVRAAPQTPEPGWFPAEARAVAEAIDIKTRAEHSDGKETGVATWSHGSEPRYHLVELDTSYDSRPGELDGRCAALEAGYLDGAGWMRLYTDGRFGEGSFTRVMERVRNDLRKRLGTPGEQQRPPSGNQGLC